MRYGKGEVTIFKDGRRDERGTAHAREVTERYTHCWKRAACEGAELPKLRRTAGVCEACMRALRNRSSIAATELKADGIGASSGPRYATRSEARLRGQQATKASKGFTFKIADAQLEMQSGSLRLVTGVTVRGQRPVKGVMTEVAQLEVRCECGAQYLIDRARWTAAPGRRVTSCNRCKTKYARAGKEAAGLAVYGVAFIGKRAKGEAAA